MLADAISQYLESCLQRADAMSQHLPDSKYKWQVLNFPLTIQEDPELKPLFEQAKSGHPTALMKMLTDPGLTQKVMGKLNSAPGPAASGEEPEINNLWEAAK